MKFRSKSQGTSVLFHAALPLMLLTVTFSSCSSPQRQDSDIALFQRTVASCVCNYLDHEDDHPSGLTYEDFIEDCNKTVRDSHANRFTDIEDSEPEMDSLSCPEKVESWLKVIAKQKQLRENNRELMQQVLHDPPDTLKNSGANEE